MSANHPEAALRALEQFLSNEIRRQRRVPHRDTAVDEHILNLEAWEAALIKLRIDGPAQDNTYRDAWYEIAYLLGIGAQSMSPKDVHEKQVMPRLRALRQIEAAPCGVTGNPWDWPEDSEEQAECFCVACHRNFVGRKTRVICKRCADPVYDFQKRRKYRDDCRSIIAKHDAQLQRRGRVRRFWRTVFRFLTGREYE